MVICPILVMFATREGLQARLGAGKTVLRIAGLIDLGQVRSDSESLLFMLYTFTNITRHITIFVKNCTWLTKHIMFAFHVIH